MNDSKISVRYSKALFDSAVEKNMLEEVYNDMLFVSDICGMPEIQELLRNPVILPSKKKKIFNAVFGDNISDETMSLIDLVIMNGRESFLPAIARVFLHTTLKHRGITESVLTTAVKLNSKLRKQVTDLISKVFETEVKLEEKTDPGIIGGFILRIEDNYMDASIRNKLRKIEKELKGSSITS
jgi:F-type H+-transporting ATPase subunit delta